MPMDREALARAKANLKAEVRAELTKKELLQFRCEPDLMARIMDVAGKKKMPVGTMIREWVAERLALEESGAAPPLAVSEVARLLMAIDAAVHEAQQVLPEQGAKKR